VLGPLERRHGLVKTRATRITEAQVHPRIRRPGILHDDVTTALTNR
jgi:hypothetical protein